MLSPHGGKNDFRKLSLNTIHMLWQCAHTHWKKKKKSNDFFKIKILTIETNRKTQPLTDSERTDRIRRDLFGWGLGAGKGCQVCACYSSGAIHLDFWDRVSYLTRTWRTLNRLGCLASKPGSSQFPELRLKTYITRVGGGVFMLSWQALYYWVISPAPRLFKEL